MLYTQNALTLRIYVIAILKSGRQNRPKPLDWDLAKRHENQDYCRCRTNEMQGAVKMPESMQAVMGYT